MKMRIFYNAGNKEREQLATIAQQYAKAVGVELEVIAEEWNAYLNRVNRTRDMEMYVLGWSSGLEPHGSQNIWIMTAGRTPPGSPMPRWTSLFQGGPSPAAARPTASGSTRRSRSSSPPTRRTSSCGRPRCSAPQQPPGAEQDVEAGYDYRPWEWYSKTGK